MARRESSVERSFYNYVKKCGDVCLKITTPTYPDRIVLFSNQKFYFIELKREDEEPRNDQLSTMETLKEKGFRVHWADCIEVAVWQYEHEKKRAYGV